MDDNQLGRRNLTPDQFRLLLGRKYNRLKAGGFKGNQHVGRDQNDPYLNTAESLAKDHGVSAPTVKRAGSAAETIDTQGAPELVEAVQQGKDPLGYVISLNLQRRHLNESQRAMVAAKLADMKLGDNQYRGSANLQTQTRAEAAQKLSVSERSVNTAKAVQRTGIPEIQEKVEVGAVSVSGVAPM